MSTASQVVKAMKDHHKWLMEQNVSPVGAVLASASAANIAFVEHINELVANDLWTIPATPKPPEPKPTGDLPVNVDPVTEWPEQADGLTDAAALVAVANRWRNRTVPPVVDVFVAGDSGGGLALGEQGWVDAWRYDPDWLGNSKLRIIGFKQKRLIRTAGENTIIVRPTPKWAGKVEFHNFTIEAGSRNLIDAGRYGSQTLSPVEVGFFDCDWVDGPKPCVRPGSFNQTQLTAARVNITCPTALEHAFYGRNLYRDWVFYEVHVDGIGAQGDQEVERKSEGPNMARGTTHIIDCSFKNFHKDDGRAGSCLTFTAGRDTRIVRTLIEDLDESDDVYGAIVAYDGGGKGYKLPSGQTNGKIEIVDSTINMGAGNRDLASFRDAEELIVTGTSWNSANGKPVSIENVLKGQWSGNSGNVRVFLDSGPAKYALNDFQWGGTQ